MSGDAKRQDSMAPVQVQEGNKSWWTRNTMSYDWHGELKLERFSKEWFDRIDERFIHSARLFATDQRPFDRIMPLDQLAGKRVLEIGCGMGLHSETMIRAGANLTAIDISPTSVEATTRRLQVKGLKGEIIEGDAEKLPFPDGEFDFVWSWGVIHHSSNTGRIVRQIARVLKPGGETRIMVYNREGRPARIAFWWDHIAKLGFLKRSYEESLYRSTDGFSARFYPPEQFEDLFRTFFRDVHSEILGVEPDVLPLPRHLRRIAMKFVSDDYLRKKQAKYGAFIFLTAKNPS